MTETAATHLAHEKFPPLSRDRGFWGMTVTQFLGAFNDNLFKQLILLLCVVYDKGDQQAIAQGMFALPFVLFSGFAGFLSDRISKRQIIVLCKVAEIAVMLVGIIALRTVEQTGELTALLVVLFLMGTQSAFFGPAKYGILPEMVRQRDLPAVNGIIQMTTFMAIIFGTAAAGYVKEWFADQLWIITAACVAIAVLGTITSLLVRRTPVAHPGLQLELSSLGINAETRRLLRRDRPLLNVLLVSSLFWFVGGLVLPSVNKLGIRELHFDDARTSLLAVCMGVGIAIGCVLTGKLSKKRLRFEFVTIGAWGLMLGLVAVTALDTCLSSPPVEKPSGSPVRSSNSVDIVEGNNLLDSASDRVQPESFAALLVPLSTKETLIRIALVWMGLSAGMFVVPLQVLLQVRPPNDQKGRMIGAMNLVNWIGILLSAVFYEICKMVYGLLHVSSSWTFAAAGLLMLPVALFYRPREESLT